MVYQVYWKFCKQYSHSVILVSEHMWLQKFVNLITSDVRYIIKWLEPPDLFNKENEKKIYQRPLINCENIESLQNFFVEENL